LFFHPVVPTPTSLGCILLTPLMLPTPTRTSFFCSSSFMWWVGVPPYGYRSIIARCLVVNAVGFTSASRSFFSSFFSRLLNLSILPSLFLLLYLIFSLSSLREFPLRRLEAPTDTLKSSVTLHCTTSFLILTGCPTHASHAYTFFSGSVRQCPFPPFDLLKVMLRCTDSPPVVDMFSGPPPHFFLLPKSSQF